MTQRRAPKRKLSNAVASKAKAPKTGFFYGIPRHNQLDVLRKLEFKDFVQFEKCSKETVELAKNFKHRLPLKLIWTEIHSDKLRGHTIGNYEDFNFDWRITNESLLRLKVERLEISATHYKGIAVEEFIREHQWTAETLVIEKKFDPDFVADLLKILKATKLKIHLFTPSMALVNHPEIKLVEIEFEHVSMKPSEFSEIEAPKLTIVHRAFRLFAIPRFVEAHLAMINGFFKQWLEGERKIEQLVIDQIFREHTAIFDGLEHKVLYKPGMKELLHDDCQFEQERVYSLRRNDDKVLLISITSGVEAFINARIRWKMVASESSDGDVQKWLRSIRETCTPK